MRRWYRSGQPEVPGFVWGGPRLSSPSSGRYPGQGGRMRITDITTTQLFVPGLPGFMDATIRHRGSGRGALFVHIKTDEGIEGFAPAQGEAKGIIEGPLKSILVGQDPLWHEK